MLEVKHLKKEYKTKNGVVTKALDDVSLNFPETGMVFILGKSGSGKSTLLNVCGGLDRMDDGEIIIKGKSSKDFSAQDFDSYRNTYVGFVFQEYNILDEFTVEQNIALALELQNKKPDNEIIRKILADVDLADLAARKPNTLSGGQKQRVAIARALVKEPQIIMADEPTGALDSKTGQQVFDTLKKLSKEKLVLVISHDRDFAEQYGDRIIELKDGKIISDQTRAETNNEQNVRFYGTDTVCVTNGAELSDTDLINIKNFLAKSGGTALISTSHEKIAQFKEDRPEINAGTFENIKEQPIPKQYEPQKLIRSHLPVKHAIKMGAGSLKTKPVRLVFTILLSVVAFVLFGLASTLMLFDGREVSVQSFTDSNINYVSLGKIYYVTYDYVDDATYIGNIDTKFTKAEYEEYAKKYSGAIPMISHRSQIFNLSLSSAASGFYSNYLEGIVPASDKLKLLAGRMPQADDEVAITDFLFNAAKSHGSMFVYGDDNTQLTIKSYQDVLYSEQKPIMARTSDGYYKIVGVFRGSDVPDDYRSRMNSADSGSTSDDSEFSSWMWEMERQSGMYATVAMTEEMFDAIAQSIDVGDLYDRYFKCSNDSATIHLNGNYLLNNDEWSSRFGWFATYNSNSLNIYGLDGNRKTFLEGGEAAISIKEIVGAYYWAIEDYVYQFQRSEYIERLNNVRSEASTEYSSNHRQPDPDDDEYNDFNSEWFDAMHASWQQQRNAFIASIEGSENYDETLSTYDAEHPEPQETDPMFNLFDHERFYIAQEQYFTAKNAYVDAALENARSDADKKYAALLARLEEQATDKYIEENGTEPDRETAPDEYETWQSGLQQALDAVNPYYVMSNLYESEDGEYTLQDVVYALDLVAWAMDELEEPITFTIYNNMTSEQPVDVVAFFMENTNSGCYLGADLYDMFYVERQDDYQTKYNEPIDACIDNILIPYDGSRALITKLLDKSGVKQKDDSAVKIKNTIIEQLEMVIDTADTLETAFIIAGAVLALFAFLLMFNFISASITAKKKDIGILRAIGARTIDVFKIFISEAFIIALICFVISTIGTFGLCMLLNTLILEDVGLSISLFVFGPLSVLSVFGIAFITAVISTGIPVGIYSRKPPVSSIRAL
ncbi:MAG: ABC transporter ATP-binding protein/permease [Clostridiales bacterium]|nr:ABC transporter ATP-binding protein/permease [Clostridiales bacterium]